MTQEKAKQGHTSRITFNGRTYSTPFRHLVRPHTKEELDSLLKSGRETNGWVSPVFTYDSTSHGPAFIDGQTRAELSEQTGLPVTHVHLEGITDEVAELMATDLNVARRHLTGKEQSTARQERIKRIAAMRRAGKSQRAIADAEKISQKQVRNDLKESEVSTPTQVEGRDGKTYSVPEMLREIRKRAYPGQALVQPEAEDSAPLAPFPRTHPHADLAARLDGLIRISDSLPSVLAHLRRARQSLLEAA